jgi:hypothetical protein
MDAGPRIVAFVSGDNSELKAGAKIIILRDKEG